MIEICGPDWALGGAIEMRALGLTSFPLNATGKIQKSEITPLVEEYMSSR